MFDLYQERINMNTYKTRNTLIASLAVLLSTTALQSHADDSWYVGTAISQTAVDESGIDDDDTGGKIYGGYRFNEYFSIEGSYYDFGDNGEDNNELGIDGVGLAAVGSIPLSDKVLIFGKIGIHAWDADISGPIEGQFNDDSDEDVFYGVGLAYELNAHWNIRGELERYEVDDFDLDVASVGLTYNF